MKFFLLLILFSLSFFSHAQNQKKKSNGYGQIGATFFSSTETDLKTGVVAGLGFMPHNNLSLGTAFEFYVFGKESRFMQGHFDFRIYFISNKKPVSPYLSIQPGYVFYNKSVSILGTTIATKGDFAVNAFFGVKANPKKGVGPFLNIGYSSIGFKSGTTKYSYDGFKAQLGISF